MITYSKHKKKILMHLKPEILKSMIYVKYLMVLSIVNFANRNGLGNNMKIIVFIYSLNEIFFIENGCLMIEKQNR